jgi:hypothetical protein
VLNGPSPGHPAAGAAVEHIEGWLANRWGPDRIVLTWFQRTYGYAAAAVSDKPPSVAVLRSPCPSKQHDARLYWPGIEHERPKTFS